MIDVDTTNFEKEVYEREGEYLLLFHAEWSIPSQALVSDLRGLNSLDVLIAEVDNVPLEAHRFDIRGIPTLLRMRDGKVVKKKIGYDVDETISGVMEE